MMPMTAEKEKAPIDDKGFIQAKTQQVLDELAGVDGFTELIQKGLKSMTHKMFINIIHHFLKRIVSNVTIDGSNYVEYIYNLLTELDYPYNINKSSLKTPSAPHCQNGIIVLLAWLSEFTVKETENEPLFQYSTTDDFDLPELSEMFMKKTANAFILWNNQQEVESDQIFTEIRETYIQQKIGNGGNLDAEIDRYKKAIDDLQKDARPNRTHLQNLYAEKRQELKVLMQQCEEINVLVKENMATIKSMKADLEKKRAAQATVCQELSEFRNKLSRQKMTLEQKNALLMEISEKRSVLANQRENALEVLEASSENEIRLSLLIQKKFHLVETLNNFIYKLASDLEIAGWGEDPFDPSAYEIKATKLSQTKGLSKEITRLHHGLKVLQEKYQQALSSIIARADKLDGEKHQLVSENAIVFEELDNLKASIEKINADENLMEIELQHLLHNNTEICNQIIAEIETMDNDIKVLKDNITKFHELNPRLVADHKAFQESSLVKIKEYYNKRKEEVLEQRQKIAEIKQFLEEFRKINQPFPAEVQITIDEVVMKQATEFN